MDCPMVVCAQLNRGSVLENRAPRKEDFRDSGAIEQAAHRVLLLYRPNEDFSGISQMDTEESPRRYYDYQIIQAKLRDGPKGSVKAKFDSHSTTFSPYTGM
jgi:replicative DNA helicase